MLIFINGTYYGFQYFYIVMLDVRIMHKVSHTKIITHTSKYGNYKFTSDQSSSILERAKSSFLLFVLDDVTEAIFSGHLL